MKSTLEDAIREIEGLRRENEKLTIKVETFEKCFMMVRALQPQSCGSMMTPDVVYALNERLRDLNEQKQETAS